MAVLVPILSTNSFDEFEITNEEAGILKVGYLEHSYVIQPDETTCDRCNEDMQVEGERNKVGSDSLFDLFPCMMPNRNGLYRLAQWTYRDRKSIRFRFR